MFTELVSNFTIVFIYPAIRWVMFNNNDVIYIIFLEELHNMFIQQHGDVFKCYLLFVTRLY